MTRLPFALVVVLTTTVVAQELPSSLSAATRIESAASDDNRVCTDDAMTVCLTVGEIRALAHVAGELGLADRDHRDLLAYQSLYVTTLGQFDECRGQLGPLRMQANARALEEQFTAWIADLERRTGRSDDRQTGALVPRKDEGGPK
jgi:hypothetical protein